MRRQIGHCKPGQPFRAGFLQSSYKVQREELELQDEIIPQWHCGVFGPAFTRVHCAATSHKLILRLLNYMNSTVC